jgi:hypothetical protein
MISYVSQKVLISSHAVAKYGDASAHPAFMGRLSPALYWLVVPAHHAENVTNFGVRQDFTDFRQTIAVNMSAHRRPIIGENKKSVHILTTSKLEAVIEIHH